MSMFSARSSVSRRRRLLPINVSLEDIDTQELFTMVHDMQKSISYVELENTLIERFLERNDPALLVGITKLMKKPKRPTKIQFASVPEYEENNSQKGSSLVGSMISRQKLIDDTSSIGTATSFNRSLGSSMRTTDSLRQNSNVSYAVKINLCDKECAIVCREMEKLQQETKQKLRDLIASVDELKLTNREAIETLNDFTEFVHGNGVNEITKKEPLEKFLKFIDKWTKNGNALIENMHMKSTTLKQNYGQLKTALAIKSELSGILRPIDFEQLEIDKRQFLEIIDVKNTHLYGLKTATGKASLVLSNQRKVLLKSEEGLAKIKKTQEKTKRAIEKLCTEKIVVLKEIDELKDNIDKIQNKINTYEAPSIMDYMNIKQKLAMLEKELKSLKRFRHINSIKLKNLRKELRQTEATKLAEQKQKELAAKEFHEMIK